MPFGRLVEYATPLAPLAPFDGVLRDSARTDMDGFRHLYATALTSRIYGSDTLPGILTFNQRVQALAPPTSSAAIPVAVQYINYSSLRPDAETAGLVTLQNEQLFDVPGRTQSPYQTAVLFAAAPERTYSASNTVSLVLRRNLYLTGGAPSTAPALYLDFGDGQGYRPATWSQSLSTTYSSAGTKRIKVKLVYTYRPSQVPLGRVGTQAIPPSIVETRESWFDLTVLSVAVASRYTTGVDIPFAPTIGSFPRADHTDHKGALVSIRYGQGHTQLVKPFIVVEGYSTASIAPHLVGANNMDNTIDEFLEKTATDPSPFDLNNSLEQAGYDLVYINFTSGTDDIRRNAALFQAVIEEVNRLKALTGSPEKNVVMGMSMGGLVARYGLARMVRGGLDPQTRLLLLHDSPQRGAYSPLGLQALTRQASFGIFPNVGPAPSNQAFILTSDVSDKLKEALAILDAPATKQLSILNATDDTGGYEANSFIDGPYKTVVNFSDYPNGVAPPTFPQIVATSDGSQCGLPQNVAPHQELAHNDRLYFLTALWVVGAGIRSEANANALPVYGTQDRIAHLRVWIRIQVLWSRIDILVRNRNYGSPPNTLPYETLPGGAENLSDQQGLAGDYNHPFLLWHWLNNTSFYNGNICFVPTFSALDVPSISPATAYAKYVNNTTNNPTPPRVKHYIAMEQTSGTQFNQSHLRFTARNAQWIFNEMETGSQPATLCSTECNPYPAASIIGPEGFCANGQATYTVSPLLPGVTVEWEVNPEAEVTPLSGTGVTFTVTTNGGVPLTGDFTLTARLRSEGGCLLRTLTLGVSAMPNELYVDYRNPVSGRPPLTVCPYEPIEFSLFSINYNPTTIKWYAGQQGAETYRATGSDGVSLDGKSLAVFDVGNANHFSVYVRAFDYCDNTLVASPPIVLTVDPNCIGIRPTLASAQVPTAVLYPNPARETVDVHIEEATPTNPVVVRLFDSQGRQRAEKSSTGQATVNFRTDQLPTGLYFVHILRGQHVLSRQQLRIEK